jgi:hypothetical protein
MLWLNLSHLEKYIIDQTNMTGHLQCCNHGCLHVWTPCLYTAYMSTVHITLPRGLYEHQVMGYTPYRETLLILSFDYMLTPLWGRNGFYHTDGMLHQDCFSPPTAQGRRSDEYLQLLDSRMVPSTWPVYPISCSIPDRSSNVSMDYPRRIKGIYCCHVQSSNDSLWLYLRRTWLWMETRWRSCHPMALTNLYIKRSRSR